MAATVEPAAGSNRLQHFIWAMGEARIRRLDDDVAPELVEGPAADADPVADLPDTLTHLPVQDTPERGVPPDVDCADFFTEWQPPGPA